MPGGPAASGAPPDTGAAGAAVGLALAAGAGLALQSRVNGAFALRLGDAAVAPVLAALASFGVGTVVVAALALAAPAGRASLRRPAPGAVPGWMLSGGLFGAVAVSTAALAVPVVGVALFSVGVVAGQTTGGLLVDRLGLGPGGRRPLSVPRVLGAGLAVGAVGLGAAAVRADAGSLLLLVLVAASGLGLATQAAVNGRLALALGDPRGASLVSFVIGVLALTGVAAVLLAATGPALAGPPPLPLWTSGFLGAVWISLTTAFVGRVGVLRWSLAAVAGQLAGALLLDVAAPVPGHELSAASVAGVALTFVAVVVAGRPARATAPAAATIGR